MLCIIQLASSYRMSTAIYQNDQCCARAATVPNLMACEEQTAFTAVLVVLYIIAAAEGP
jgi:hypothetical protein